MQQLTTETFPSKEEESLYLARQALELDISRAMAWLDATTDLSEVNDMRKKVDAIRAAAREVGVQLDKQNGMAVMAIETRCRVATLYDQLPDQTGKRNDLTLSIAVDEVTERGATLEDLGVNRQTMSNWRAVAGLPREQREEIYNRTIDKHEELTFTRLRQVAKARAGHEDIHWKTSESNEWYTPAEYIASAKTVMGAIDLDPASHENANQFVEAAQFFTVDDDGLCRPWRGRVWLNPPYGKTENKSIVDRWAEKFIDEYTTGRMAQGILLVGVMQLHLPAVQAVVGCCNGLLCLSDHYIRFHSSQRDTTKKAPTGSAFFYVGPNKDNFSIEFSQYGMILNNYIGEDE